MTWFLLMETMLAAAWATFRGANPASPVMVTWFVGVLGILGCLSIALGVSAAQRAIAYLKECYDSKYPGGKPDERLPAMIGRLGHHRQGKSAQYVIILLVGLAWFWLLGDQGGLIELVESWIRQAIHRR
jgi:hypothetical protein